MSDDYLGVPVSPTAESSRGSTPSMSANNSNSHSRHPSPLPHLTVKLPQPATTAPEEEDTPQLFTPIMSPPNAQQQAGSGISAGSAAAAAPPVATATSHSVLSATPPVGNAAVSRASLNSMAHGNGVPSTGSLRGAPLPPTAATAAAAGATASSALPPRSALKHTAPLQPDGAPLPPAAAAANGAGSRRNSSFQSALGADAAHVTSTFFHACTDYRPLLSKRSEYFATDVSSEQPISMVGSVSDSSSIRARSDSTGAPLVRDVISVVVPCFTESGRSLQKTLYDLWIMQEHMHKNKTYFHFHVCIILDGWSKAPPSLQAYIKQLFQSEDEHESVKFSALQKEVAAEAEKALYPDASLPPPSSSTTRKTAAPMPSINGDSSSEVSSDTDSSDSDEDDEEAPSSHERKARDVKFQSRPLLRPSPTRVVGAPAPAPALSSSSSASAYAAPFKSSARASPAASDSSFLFPDSASFSGGFAHPDQRTPSKTQTWERYISNWSADSDLNPPMNPETLIVQKWVGVAEGAAEEAKGEQQGGDALPPPPRPGRTIMHVPIFPGLAEELAKADGADRIERERASSPPVLGADGQPLLRPLPPLRRKIKGTAAEELRRKAQASLKLTVIIKRDNRRKHNSHEWFLTSFAPVYTTRLLASSTSASGVQLVFMTDAGTRFHESCVLSLVQHALQSPSTVACSGRQRVMTHKMQQEGEPPQDKLSFDFLRGQLYRCAQGFEYEASISAFNGAFDFTGMLPVLPGPCGLFRLDLMLREGGPEEQARAREMESLRIQVGKLRGIHTNCSRALGELHAFVWSALTVTKQVHRATWSAYTKRQLLQSRTGGASGNSASTSTMLEPFTPYEKAEAAFEYVELKTQLFALTNELQHQQLVLITVLLRMGQQEGSASSGGAAAAAVAAAPLRLPANLLPQMLSSESLHWTRMQSLLVLVRQLAALEATNSIPPDWDRQMHIQLQNLRKLITQQILSLKQFLQRIAEITPATGPPMAEARASSSPNGSSSVVPHGSHPLSGSALIESVKLELSLDPDEQDHLVSLRALDELSRARDPIMFYLAVVNQVPGEVDLITANLMLAEDRILSYAVVLMADQPVTTDFVPDSLFFFEAETEAENALQQSRRWTNGTVAGFLWLFCSGIKFRQSRFLVYVLVACQLIMYLIVGLSPSLWTIGLHYSLQLWFGDAPAKYADWIVLFYLGMYAAFVLMHSSPTPGHKRLHAWLFHCFTVVNMLVATMPLAALVPNFIDGCREDNDGWPRFMGFSIQCWILGSAVLGTLVLPFLLAILYDLYSLMPACNKRPVSRRLRNCPYGLSWVWQGWGSITWEMLTCAVWFYLFLPTKVSLYPCYAFSRTWELTWGNKPSDALHSITSSKTPRQLERTKKDMLQLSQVISYSLLLGNILLFLVVSEVGVKSGVLVVLTAFILLWALVQMLLSLCWILYRLLVAPVFKGVRVVAEWLDVFEQDNRPVPGSYQAYQEREARRQGQRSARGTPPSSSAPVQPARSSSSPPTVASSVKAPLMRDNASAGDYQALA